MTSRIHSPNLVQSVSRWSIVAVAVSVFVCGLVWRNANLLGVGAAILCFVLRRAWDGASSETPSRPQHRSRKRENDRSVRVVRERRKRTAGRQRTRSGRRADAARLSAKKHRRTRRRTARQRPLRAHAPAGNKAASHAIPVDASDPPTRRSDGPGAGRPRAGRPTRRDIELGVRPVGNRSETDAAQSGHGRADLLGSLLRHQRRVPADSSTRAATSSSSSGTKKRCPRCSTSSIKPAHPGRASGAMASIRPTMQHLPVVGVSWFEAWAYARWVGKRLPSDAEWTKAAAWPVESAPGRIAQRRYPWGESFDVRRAHLYGSGHSAPVPVDEFPGGTSVGGIHQLIGNVWEWTSTPLADAADPTLHVSESVMSVRGGAFDTYFENQATCHFQSGEQALSRRRNIGFRLALPMSDLESAKELRRTRSPTRRTGTQRATRRTTPGDSINYASPDP